ncbi:hypothetical protein HED60_03245 [Planctomycetales bacterium ZRK34]|nr:hypothetical protein HED60_03245 [Planctomycetales bacterium ZRK34]
MKTASSIFNDEQRRQVNAAVAAAESKTSAEIVPAVATASGRYDRPEDVAGLWLGGAAAIITWALLPARAVETGDWSGLPGWVTPVSMIAALLAGFILGAVIASRCGWIRRLFTPATQMHDEVAARARGVFFDSTVHHTAGATGVLIYVSLFERRAVVLADKVVVEKLGQSAIDELRDQLTTSLRDHDVPTALCHAIEAAGEKLAPVLPRQADDVNELPDSLVLLD